MDELAKHNSDSLEISELAKRVIKFELETMKKQLHLDLFVIFVSFKYSDKIWQSYLKHQDENQQIHEQYFEVKHNND